MCGSPRALCSDLDGDLEAAARYPALAGRQDRGSAWPTRSQPGQPSGRLDHRSGESWGLAGVYRLPDRILAAVQHDLDLLANHAL